MRRRVFSSSIGVTRASSRVPDERSDHLRPSAPPGRNVLRVAAQSLFTIFLPSSCRLCDLPLLEISRIPVCRACLESVQPTSEMCCERCGEALPVPFAEQPVLCGMCRRAAPYFDGAVAFAAYDGALRGLIHLLKYGEVKTAAVPLGKLLAVAIEKLGRPAAPLLVVPVPLDGRKQRERGFNQSELLARLALAHLKEQGCSAWELHANNLKRIRKTESQTGLTRHQRRANVRGAFALADRAAVRGRSVLLVDDVLTTGTTLNECARVLRSAGAEKVWVATVARVFRHAGSKLVPFDGEEKREHREDKACVAAAHAL